MADIFDIWEIVKKRLEEKYQVPIFLLSIKEAYKEKDVYVFRVVLAEPKIDGKYRLVEKKILYDPSKDEIVYIGEENDNNDT